MDLLRQNSELRRDRVWNWTLPAWYVRLEGKIFKTCPNAGVCAQFCYARNGTYLFSNVQAAHLANLELARDRPEEFLDRISKELRHRAFRWTGRPRAFSESAPLVRDAWSINWRLKGGAAVRIHDSGDFFSENYYRIWIEIARRFPRVLFYAYTKEVSMTKRLFADGSQPRNLRIIFSKGGLEDHLIDDEVDRHADVFPSLEALEAAGYTDQAESDLLAVMLETNRIGIVANNISHFRKKQGSETFGSMAKRRD